MCAVRPAALAIISGHPAVPASVYDFLTLQTV
jgi:hypothetical protein